MVELVVSSSIKRAKEFVKSRDFFEAGEILFSTGEIIEDIDVLEAQHVYMENIKIWELLIEQYKAQANLHEIAEIYLKIADIYGEKLSNEALKTKNLANSIEYLKQETALLITFNETRKVAQNYQNIAELCFKISEFSNAIQYYQNTIAVAKKFDYYDLISYSYQQIALCYEELDDFNKSKEIILDSVEYFASLFNKIQETNNNLVLAQIAQILKTLYHILHDKEQFLNYSKKEASAYVNLAENLEKTKENLQKIARFYRGAGLCYQEINDNLIESASCFVLAGNYSEKIKDFNEAAINLFDAAKVFKELKNYEMAYKNFMKAGDNFWSINDVNQSTESYLNAYDVASEANLEFNRFGLFNQIVRGLNMIAKDGLKDKQFFTSASLILESIKFYEQLETVNDVLLREMVRNLYRYYYRAADLKKISFSHIVNSYVLASLSCILIRKLDKAWEILSEVENDGFTIANYKDMIKIIIDWVKKGKPVEIDNLPFHLRRLIDTSEDITYLFNLFKRM